MSGRVGDGEGTVAIAGGDNREVSSSLNVRCYLGPHHPARKTKGTEHTLLAPWFCFLLLFFTDWVSPRDRPLGVSR